ncbi:MAG: AMP-binding protein [Cyclobacteriaceae bacterium]|nr:AMP-binding protein [Cyclobacteriaceae bacterium]
MNSVLINGNIYSPDQLFSGTFSEIDLNSFARRVLEVIREWGLGRKKFEFKTSGSTGTPKIISIGKEKMLTSARSTLEYLQIKDGKCLLCLDPEFIAGTMMIIRALVGGMDLIALQPASNPMGDLPADIDIELSAFVPLQLHEILKDPGSEEKFKKISNVLIGGADLSGDLISQLSGFPNRIYHTFGMTETVTDFALKKISGGKPDEYYHAVPGIELSTDDRGCLVIIGNITGNIHFITNDRVELIDQKRFRWLGRVDHIINSGGIKIQVEVIEKKVEGLLRERRIKFPFFITGIPDQKFGEKTTIVFESGGETVDKKNISEILNQRLPAFEMPREWRSISLFIRTSTGKIDRIRSLKASTVLA